MRGLQWWFGAGALALAGCGGVISKEVRTEAAPLRSFAELRESPQAFVGKTVILAGEVIEARNAPGGTTLLVLEKPMEYGQRPEEGDRSGGRFLARFSQYLDPVVFAKGRRVTVAGVVVGVENEKVGDAPYPYVVLTGREVYLWRETPYPASPPYPWYPYWYDPDWGHRPWWW